MLTEEVTEAEVVDMAVAAILEDTTVEDIMAAVSAFFLEHLLIRINAVALIFLVVLGGVRGSTIGIHAQYLTVYPLLAETCDVMAASPIFFLTA